LFRLTSNRLYESLPKQTQKALDQANGQGVLNSKSYDSSLNKGPTVRPATSHADRPSLKQFIKDKKHEATKKTGPSHASIERPKSAAPTHDRNRIDASVHSLRKATKALEASPSRAASPALSTASDRHHRPVPQDLKRVKKPKEASAADGRPISTESTTTNDRHVGTTQPQKKPVRRPVDRPDSVIERPKSSASTSSTVASKPARLNNKPVPTRPKTVAAVSTPGGIGGLSSAPKRPAFSRKAVTTGQNQHIATTAIPLDASTDLADDAALVAPEVSTPLTVLKTLPGEKNVTEEVVGKSTVPKRSVLDEREVTAGVVTVLTSLVADPSNDVPDDAFDVLRGALFSSDVSTRRAAIDLGVALWHRSEDAFVYWSHIGGGIENSAKNLLMYYIAKSKPQELRA
jgi:hypothetical protein